MRELQSEIPNERDDTPIVLNDPEIFLPPPADMEVERQSVKAVADGIIIDIYPHDSPADFQKIPGDVIFKQKVVPNDAASPYQDGDTLPVIFNDIDSDNIHVEFIIKGMVQFRGKSYSLPEYNYTADPEVLDDGHYYVPNSDKIRFKVFIPHMGDEYWHVAWNSREIHCTNYPKYLIHAEGLDNMLDKN